MWWFMVAAVVATTTGGKEPELHRVGGKRGWTDQNVNYTEWAMNQTFYVGDWLCNYLFLTVSNLFSWLHNNLNSLCFYTNTYIEILLHLHVKCLLTMI